MNKVNWGARSEWEYVQNYKVLQAATDKMNVDRKIDVEKLTKAKYQDNLEFMQWLKKFYDDNCTEGAANYDAQARRSQGKNVGLVKWTNSKVIPKSSPLRASPLVIAKPASRAVSPPTRPALSSRPSPHKPVATAASKPVLASAAVVSVKPTKVSVPVASLSADPLAEKENDQLIQSLKSEIQSLRSELHRVSQTYEQKFDRLKDRADTAEQERDELMNKISDIKEMISHVEDNVLADAVKAILFE